MGASGPAQMILAVVQSAAVRQRRRRGASWTANTPRSQVVWNSVDGQTYWIQVGVCYIPGTPPTWCSWDGLVTPTALVVAISDPPRYDARANAVALSPGSTYDNHGADVEAETNSCNGTQYGNTVWLKWTSPTWGTAVFNLNGMPGLISIRRAGTDAVTTADSAPRRRGWPRARRVFLQVGGGNLGALGFDEGHFSIAPSIPDPDDDNDGHVNASDCQPLNAAVNPGRPEIKDDGVDQNCNPPTTSTWTATATGPTGPRTATTPMRTASPATSSTVATATTRTASPATTRHASRRPLGLHRRDGRLQKFALNDVLKRSRIVVTCRGRSCRRSKIVVTKRLKRNVKRLSSRAASSGR